MESFFSRYRNPLILMAVLFIQVIALATQIKRPDHSGGQGTGDTRLIRRWTVTAITPVEEAFVGTGHFFRNSWHNYIDLHDVRKQNRELQEQIDRMKLEQARLREDAERAHRLEALLAFKQRFIAETVAAQVIGTSGSEMSHVIYIDKGSRDGMKPNMPVITPDGIVGKIKEVYRLSSQVLLINDRESGAGVILVNARLQGVLRGRGLGEVQVNDVMSDESVQAGEQIVTSGGDQIYPKGLPVGTVSSAIADHDSEPFLRIKVKPAANLDRLEEVLVITKVAEETPHVADGSTSSRAAEVLAQRLPSVPKPEENPENKTKKEGQGATPIRPGSNVGTPTQVRKTKPADSGAAQKKPPAPPQTPQAEKPPQ